MAYPTGQSARHAAICMNFFLHETHVVTTVVPTLVCKQDWHDGPAAKQVHGVSVTTPFLLIFEPLHKAFFTQAPFTKKRVASQCQHVVPFLRMVQSRQDPSSHSQGVVVPCFKPPTHRCSGTHFITRGFLPCRTFAVPNGQLSTHVPSAVRACSMPACRPSGTNGNAVSLGARHVKQ